MSGGLLRTSETAEGQTIGLIRENGQVEDVTIVPDTGGSGGGGVVRAKWGLSASFAVVTFAEGGGPIFNVVSEPGTFENILEGETIFFQPGQCLVGVFHSGGPAPEYGGVWLILTSNQSDELTVQRAPSLSTTAQLDATGLITVDQGSGAGVYQVATPENGTLNISPQIMPWVALPPPGGGLTYKLQAVSDQLVWTEDSPP